MKEIWQQNKVFVIVIVATLALLVGGVTFFSSSSPTTGDGLKVNTEVLISKDSFKTSGVVNGNYKESTPSAKLTLIEFGDYQCPACSLYHPLIKQLLGDFEGRINFVFRNFPLTQHKYSKISSYAVEAAGLQGKFWQMHDKVYESQSEWSNSDTPNVIFEKYARDLGLDMNKFKLDSESNLVTNKVSQDLNDGNLAGVDSTPTFYINGTKLNTIPSTYGELKQIIESNLKEIK